MESCIFCQILEGKIPTKFLYRDREIAAFYDIHPIAPVHILIIPVKHIPSIVDLTPADTELVGRMILVSKELAEKENIAQDGYKLLFRVGKHGGQEINHIHLHLIGGAPLKEEIRPK